MQLTQNQARALLTSWAVINRARPALIQAAAYAGLSKLEISRLTGLNRDTVYRDLRKVPGTIRTNSETTDTTD